MSQHDPHRDRTPIPAALQASHDSALAMLHDGHGDPLVHVDRLLQAAPDFAAALCLRAAVFVMACREDARAELARTLQAANALPAGVANERERRHFAAAAAWLERDLQRALQCYGAIAVDHPHDTLALRVAHFGDLQWSRTEQLRDRIAAVLPHWHAGMPGYGHVLAMHAFGLAETGEHAQAEATGRRALALEPRSAGAIHAVAHAFEMRGRAAEGIAWLHGTAPVWTHSRGYATHLWWHLALFHLDLGDTATALQILDRQLGTAAGAQAAALVDASALLWRLQLLDIDVGARWAAVADGWATRPLGGLRPFTDTHAMLAFIGDGRPAHAQALLRELRACARRTRDLDAVIHRAALPVCEALMQFGAGHYAAATSGLLQSRHLVQRCGGSRAQCDLLHLTLLEAARRSGQQALAQSLVTERLALRPRSRLNRRLQSRVGAAPAATATPRVAPQRPSGSRPPARRPGPRVGPPPRVRGARPTAARRPRA